VLVSFSFLGKERREEEGVPTEEPETESNLEVKFELVIEDVLGFAPS